jgi:ABC-type Fe3+-hydroxamate transport system substrate-binding protein
MVVGPRTFTGDVLARLGLVNVFGAGEDRYPHVSVEALRTAGADVVLLPDEPYVFTADDGPEAFPGIRTALVSGRDLTWYGPSLGPARARLLAAIAR